MYVSYSFNRNMRLYDQKFELPMWSVWTSGQNQFHHVLTGTLWYERFWASTCFIKILHWKNLGQVRVCKFSFRIQVRGFRKWVRHFHSNNFSIPVIHCRVGIVPNFCCRLKFAYFSGKKCIRESVFLSEKGSATAWAVIQSIIKCTHYTV